jgi:peptidoglycan/LPS O-acetylase OafA/YrhL
MTRELIGIQYLRGAAVIAVLLTHLASSQSEYDFLPRWGELGVSVFFVISGFIMWHTTANGVVSPLTFWRRRIIRIVPLYWSCLAALLIVAWLVPHVLRSTVLTPENVLKSFLFIPHFHAVFKQWIVPILIPGWSLTYEMFFYFVFGLTLFARGLAVRFWLLALLLIGLVILGLLLQPSGPIAITYTSIKLLIFLGGVALAVLYRAQWLDGAIIGILLLCAGLVAAFASETRLVGDSDSLSVLTPILIVAGTLALETTARRASIGLFHTIGNASYSIYLTHLFFLKLAELGSRYFHLFGSSHAAEVVYSCFLMVFTLAGGILVYHWIEQPMLSVFRSRSVGHFHSVSTDSTAEPCVRIGQPH